MTKTPGFSITILALVGGSVANPLTAIDIKTVYSKLTHARFKASVRPLIVPEAEGEITPAQIKESSESFRTVDVKNHYMDYESESATGTLRRTYVLYFSQDGLPIFVGSEHNRVDQDKLTDLFALCQDKAGAWLECTGEIFPRLKATDLLKPGAKLDRSTAGLWALYYELPRQGTTVQLKIEYNNYALEPNVEAQIKKDLQKFRKQKFSLKWNKKKRKMEMD